MTPMKVNCVICVQDSENYASDDEHIVSRVSYFIWYEGLRHQDARQYFLDARSFEFPLN